MHASVGSSGTPKSKSSCPGVKLHASVSLTLHLGDRKMVCSLKQNFSNFMEQGWGNLNGPYTGQVFGIAGKTLPGRSTAHIRVHVFQAWLYSQFQLSTDQCSERWLRYLSPCHSLETRMEFRLLASTWPIPICEHLWSKPADGKSVSQSLFLSSPVIQIQ